MTARKRRGSSPWRREGDSGVERGSAADLGCVDGRCRGELETFVTPAKTAVVPTESFRAASTICFQWVENADTKSESSLR